MAQLADGIAATHPDMLEQLGTALALSTLKDMIRKRCKEFADRATAPLFADLGDELPRAIAVPKRGGDEPYYVGLRHATGDELAAGITLLDRNIAAAITRRDALAHLLADFEGRGGRSTDRLLDVLTPELQPA